ncbi:4Fe-4S binding protein, partial [Desulfovibrio sp. OttesenSCG-928-C14]|nr:4Fe-4S binding protein [Desulfovibrio sp. OttesenSCG-928-C14]
LVYFSATGTTRAVVEELGRGFTGTKQSYDLLRSPLTAPAIFGPDSLTIAGMPVYSGRIPQVAAQSLANLAGKGGAAIAVAVYGNRDYDDALLELADLLEEGGFALLAAGAFIARHSIFTQVAAGRPDAADLALIKDFAAKCELKLRNLDAVANLNALNIKGNRPYKEVPPSALKPSVDEKCTLCGLCVENCPTRALSLGKTLQRDAALCISCAACISVCPEQAQAFRGPAFEQFSGVFAEKCAARREPELFI